MKEVSLAARRRMFAWFARTVAILPFAAAVQGFTRLKPTPAVTVGPF